MVRPAVKSSTREGLDALAALLNPGALDDELAEHLNLFNLLGDPLLRLRLPEPVTVECPRQCRAGGELEISAQSKVAGRATVELVPRRDRLAFRPPQRLENMPASERRAEFDATYRRANDPVLARIELDVDERPFVVRLAVPAGSQGAAHVRVFVAGRDAHAAGAGETAIVSPPATAPTSSDN